MSLSSEFINDIKSIVSSDTGDIKLSKNFVEEFDITDRDMEILEASLHFNSGMTEYQCKHFVADSQLTPWRKVRQSLMELETRYHAYIEIRNSLRKAEILRKKFQQSIEITCDELDKELIAIDMEKNDYDITIWKRKLRQSEYEIKYFLNIVEEYVDEEHPLEYYTEEQEDEERVYWIARMGKQAAMDIVSYGRIGSGNMTSIMDMPEEDQVRALEVAVQYSAMIGGGIDKLNKIIAPTIQNQLSTQGIHLPKLEQHKYTGQLQLKGDKKNEAS
jgi:hypothetical protein